MDELRLSFNSPRVRLGAVLLGIAFVVVGVPLALKPWSAYSLGLKLIIPIAYVVLLSVVYRFWEMPAPQVTEKAKRVSLKRLLDVSLLLFIIIYFVFIVLVQVGDSSVGLSLIFVLSLQVKRKKLLQEHRAIIYICSAILFALFTFRNVSTCLFVQCTPLGFQEQIAVAKQMAAQRYPEMYLWRINADGLDSIGYHMRSDDQPNVRIEFGFNGVDAKTHELRNLSLLFDDKDPWKTYAWREYGSSSDIYEEKQFPKLGPRDAFNKALPALEKAIGHPIGFGSNYPFIFRVLFGHSQYASIYSSETADGSPTWRVYLTLDKTSCSVEVDANTGEVIFVGK